MTPSFAAPGNDEMPTNLASNKAARDAVLADIHFGRRVPGDGQHIRFSYAASNEAIERGIERLADFVRRARR